MEGIRTLVSERNDPVDKVANIKVTCPKVDDVIVTVIETVAESGGARATPKMETCEEAQEIIVIQDDDSIVDSESDEEVELVRSRDIDQIDVGDENNSDTVRGDAAIADVTNAEVVSIVHHPSGKEYSRPLVFTNVDTDDFTTLRGARLK